MHTTTRLALDVPDGSDAVTNYPTVSSQQMTTLDNAAIYKSGTLASRPTAGSVVSGTLYDATDTGVLYRQIGGSWVALQNGPNASGQATFLQLATAAQLVVATGTSSNVSAGGTATITHGIGRTPVNVQLTTLWADGSASASWTVYNVTSTQFTAANKGSTTANFYWLAIG
jgi:hypothetical protein